jgi:ubiquitin C-terminal hydrolase
MEQQSILFQQINKNMLGGLLNIGNTCYLNTALQCLYNVKDLNKYMLFDKKFKEELINDSVERPFTESFYETLQLLLSNQKVNPLPFIRVFFELCSTKGVDCALGRQEDSQEFLLHLIDNIHESLKYKVNIVQNTIPDTDLNKKICESHEKWQESIKDDYSIIVNLFYGQFMYNMFKTDDTKTIISNTFEKFNSISLPITSSTNTIYDCFDEYIYTEFTGDEQYFYEKENKKIDALRRCFIWKLPKYMILSFKRFNYDNTKNDQKIDIIIDGLNMSKYTHNSHESIYDLISIGCHRGGTGGGHYYAITRKSQNLWILYNDANLSKITDINRAIKSVLSDVYILIYKHRNKTTDIISDQEFSESEISENRLKEFSEINLNEYINSDIAFPCHDLFKNIEDTDDNDIFDSSMIDYSNFNGDFDEIDDNPCFNGNFNEIDDNPCFNSDFDEIDDNSCFDSFRNLIEDTDYDFNDDPDTDSDDDDMTICFDTDTDLLRKNDEENDEESDIERLKKLEDKFKYF